MSILRDIDTSLKRDSELNYVVSSVDSDMKPNNNGEIQ
jgi:hypothetical protein